jgi:hypothetical protein
VRECAVVELSILIDFNSEVFSLTLILKLKLYLAHFLKLGGFIFFFTLQLKLQIAILPEVGGSLLPCQCEKALLAT